MFGYDDAVLTRFPTIRAGVIHAAGLVNGPSPPALADDFLAEQQAARSRLEERPVAQSPSIAAWRRAFSAFGVKPTQYRNAAEALLRRLARHGDIPSISLLVDLGNLVSIRHALPVAIFDQSSVTGSTMVRFADGSERFVDLGSTEAVHPERDEVVFVDDAGVVSARRWCWRQSAGSATGPATVDALVTVEGHHEMARQDVRSALDDVVQLLRSHQPRARVTFAELSPGAAVFNPAST